MEHRCRTCDGTGWVCENHRDKPWNGVSYRFDACDCGLAAPCAVCNDPEGEGSYDY